MSFPLSPVDGYEYTSTDGIKFIYNASKNAWDISPPEVSSYEYYQLFSTLDAEYSKSVIDTNNINTDLDFSFNKRAKMLIQRDEDFSLGYVNKQILALTLLDPNLYGDFSSNTPKYSFTLIE